MAAIQLGIGQSITCLSSRPKRDLLLQDFSIVETVQFPRSALLHRRLLPVFSPAFVTHRFRCGSSDADRMHGALANLFSEIIMVRDGFFIIADMVVT